MKINKDKTETYKRWCLDGMFKEAYELQINGNGVMSTVSCIDEYFEEIDKLQSKLNAIDEVLYNDNALKEIQQILEE